MNTKLKFLLLALFIFSSQLTLLAQEEEFYTTPMIGLSSPILDNGTGFYIGVNPSFPLSRFISVESQLSFAYVKIDGSFISGETGSQSNVNALLGGRLYLLSKERKARPYFNLLVGGMYNSEEDYMEFTFGGSAGGFVEINKILLGVSVETPGNIIVKAGYIF